MYRNKTQKSGTASWRPGFFSEFLWEPVVAWLLPPLVGRVAARCLHPKLTTKNEIVRTEKDFKERKNESVSRSSDRRKEGQQSIARFSIKPCKYQGVQWPLATHWPKASVHMSKCAPRDSQESQRQKRHGNADNNEESRTLTPNTVLRTILT
jgi:hypothetical protein